MNTELLKTLQGLLRTADGPFGRHPQTREQQSGRQTVRLNEPVWGTDAKPSVVALLRRMSPVAPLTGVAGDAGETLRLNLEVSLAMTERGGRHAVAGIPAMALLCTAPAYRPKGYFDIRDEAATRLGLDDATAHALFDGPNWVGGARAWVTPDEAIGAIGHVLDGESDGHSIWRHLDRRELARLRRNEDLEFYHRAEREAAFEADACSGDWSDRKRQRVHRRYTPPRGLISETADVHPTAHVGRHAAIDNGATIEAGVWLDDGTQIGPGVSIGKGARIERMRGILEGTRIEPGTSISSRNGDAARVETGFGGIVTTRPLGREVPAGVCVRPCRCHAAAGDIERIEVEVDAAGNIRMPRDVEGLLLTGDTVLLETGRPATLVVTGSGSLSALRAGDGEGNAERHGDGDGSAERQGRGDGNAVRTGAGDGNAVRTGTGWGNAIVDTSGRGDAVVENGTRGDAIRRGTGNGHARVNGEGVGNAINSTAGEGHAERTGTGSGDAERSGAGPGNAFCTTRGVGHAMRTGQGTGAAVRRGDGEGDARRESGVGGAERSGDGNGQARVANSHEGDAVRSGRGDGNAVRTGNGDGRAVRSGEGDGSAVHDGYGAGVAVREGDGAGSARRSGWGDGDAVSTNAPSDKHQALRHGPGRGHAVRKGNGVARRTDERHGGAVVECADDGSAARSGDGDGDAVGRTAYGTLRLSRTGTGHGRRLRNGIEEPAETAGA